MRKYKILLIEDDADSAIYLQEFMDDKGYNVEIFSTITDAIFRIKFNNYDLILLDINLPDYDGYEILKYINKECLQIPVIVVSGYSDVDMKVKAFNLGAVDYMVKPIEPLELEARMRIHLGKNSTLMSANIDKPILSIKNQSIYYKDKHLKLTRIEFQILKELLKNPNQTISREKLHESISSKSSHRTLDGHIKNIRKKLRSIDEQEGNLPSDDIIVTEYGLGYRLNI